MGGHPAAWWAKDLESPPEGNPSRSLLSPGGPEAVLLLPGTFPGPQTQPGPGIIPHPGCHGLFAPLLPGEYRDWELSADLLNERQNE